MTWDENEQDATLHREAAETAQAVLELAQRIKADGHDVTDAEEFLEETRLAIHNDDFSRAIKMAHFAEKALEMITGVRSSRRSSIDLEWDERSMSMSHIPPPPEKGEGTPPPPVPPPPHPDDHHGGSRSEEEPHSFPLPEPEEPPVNPPDPEHPPPHPPDPEHPPAHPPDPGPPDAPPLDPGPPDEEDKYPPAPPPPHVDEPLDDDVEGGDEPPPPPSTDEQITVTLVQEDDFDPDATIDTSEPEPEEEESGLQGLTLGEKLGSGGFADVYLAKDSSGRNMAVKKPHIDVTSNLGIKHRKRFVEEAENWMKLYSHRDVKKGIVAIYHFAVEPEAYIAMEYMDGGSLRTQMDKMDLGEKLYCLDKVLDTLYTVHHLGIIHRDIKPENILMNKLGQWKLADWGLSKVLLDSTSSTTQAGQIKATLAYASPEQIESDDFGDVDWRTDIYQMGALAYELLTGQKPHDGEPAKLIYAIVSKEPRHPSDVNEEVPRHIGDAVMRAMKKNKRDRWQDAVEFQRALEKKAPDGKPGSGTEEEEEEAEEAARRRRLYDTYVDMVTEAFDDGKLDEDEERMLAKFRTSFDISDEQHDFIVNDLKRKYPLMFKAKQDTPKGPLGDFVVGVICPTCKGNAKYLRDYARYYCTKCETYMPEDAGSTLVCKVCNNHSAYLKDYARYFCFKCGAYLDGDGSHSDKHGKEDRKCPYCHKSSTYVQQYGRYYCESCAQYLPEAHWSTPNCLSCGNPTEWVEQYQRYFCQNCQKYN